MNLTLLQDAAAADEPLSVGEAQQYLRLRPGDDEITLSALITATRLLAEEANGRQCSKKQWRLALDRWPNTQNVFTYPYSSQYTDPVLFQFQVGPSFIELLDPLISVDAVRYKTSDGTVITAVEDTDYVVDLDKHPGVICPPYGKTWPSPSQGLWPSSAVQIDFTCGFTPENVPVSIKQGMLLLVSQMYEQRVPFDDIRSVAEIPFGVTALFNVGKIWRF